MTIYSRPSTEITGRFDYQYRVYYKHPLTKKRVQKNSKWYTPSKGGKRQCSKDESTFLAKVDYSDEASLTMNVLWEKYISEYETDNEDSSLYTIKNKFETHILPYFKNKNIFKLQVNDINDWQQTMKKLTYEKKKGEFVKYNISYLKSLYTLFKAVIQYGCKIYDLPKNVVALCGNFKQKKATARTRTVERSEYFDLEEFKKFISYADDQMYRTLFYLFYGTGARTGEIQALTWNDYNEGIIKINKSCSIKSTKGEKFVIKPPKNSSSYREIQLSDKTRKELDKYHSMCKNMVGFKKEWFMFGNTKPFSRTTVTRQKDKLCKVGNLNRITLHGFRHSHASLLINSNSNISITLISDRLGHSNITETLDTYSHLFPKQKSTITDYLNVINI